MIAACVPGSMHALAHRVHRDKFGAGDLAVLVGVHPVKHCGAAGLMVGRIDLAIAIAVAFGEMFLGFRLCFGAGRHAVAICIAAAVHHTLGIDDPARRKRGSQGKSDSNFLHRNSPVSAPKTGGEAARPRQEREMTGAARLPTLLIQPGCRGFMPAAGLIVAICRGMEPAFIRPTLSERGILHRRALGLQPVERRTVHLRADDLQHPRVIVVPPGQFTVAQQ